MSSLSIACTQCFWRWSIEIDVGARRQRRRPRIAAVLRVVRHGERRGEPPHDHVHALQAPDERLHLARPRRLVGADEVAADRQVGHGLLDRVARLHDLVGLELAGGALALGLDPAVVPALQDRVLVRRGLRKRRPLRQVLLADALVRRVRVRLLERHARGAEARGGHRVAVAHVEEVVRRVVEVRDLAGVEDLLHRGPVEVVDPADRLARQLVVDRVGVGREEVAGRVAHLVGVDEQHRREAGAASRPCRPSPAACGRTSRGSCRSRRRCGACRPRGRPGSASGRITTTASSRIRCAAQSVRSASSCRTRSEASVPLSSPPCTLPAIHRIAGRLAAIAAASAGGVAGSISFAASARTAARPCGGQPVGLPDDRVAQIAALHAPRRGVPVITRAEAASTAAGSGRTPRS